MSKMFESEVRELLDNIGQMLIEKNAQYGNSALDPLRIFSRAGVTEQILVRIDDKLSRLSRSEAGVADHEDVVTDLIGYLVLLKIAQDRSAAVVAGSASG